MLFFVSNLYSQNIEIITTKDSLTYYFEKYKESKSISTFKIKAMRVSYVFLDEDNFKGGGSLGVLFYGALFVWTQIMILLIVRRIKFIRSK
jgi:RNA recognition motif-containing protein